MIVQFGRDYPFLTKGLYNNNFPILYALLFFICCTQ